MRSDPVDRRIRLTSTPLARARAKELRKNMTLGEAILWTSLKGKQMHGYDFDRQKPIGNYIVDFFCKELMLAIEVDGETHRDNDEYDADRQKRLESLGVRFLRFDDAELRARPQDALRAIEGWIAQLGERTREE